jgi:L,D-transpeptidase ErfK/SrfK
MTVFLIALLLVLLPDLSPAETIIGEETFYLVAEADSLQLISAKLGVDVKNIVRENVLDPKAPLPVGQELLVNTRKIVPKTRDWGIIVNIPDRMLYYFKEGRLQEAFPVGLGMPSWRGMKRWRTPTGEFTITAKTVNPVWYVPQSIQWKLSVQGKPVPSIVPPGPDNPLGRFALYTSIRGIAIHETIWPTTVYKFRSHGCIRVLTEHIVKFFDDVETGTPGEIIYQPVKAAKTETGKVFLEVHPDIYGKVKDLRSEAVRLIEELGASGKVDWDRVNAMVNEKTGMAEDVTAASERWSASAREGGR